MSKGKRTATKFVTLTGEIVNSSGAMTGGNLKSGKGGLLTRKSELLELTSKIKNMEEENKTLIEKKENVQSDILKTDADLDKKILEKNKNEDRLTEINRDVAVLEMKNEELNFSRERTRQELKKLSEQLDESQKMANDLKIKVAEMEDEMQNLISKTETDRIENEKIKEDLREHSETITHGRISLSKATAEYDAANEALGAVREWDFRLQNYRPFSVRQADDLLFQLSVLPAREMLPDTAADKLMTTFEEESQQFRLFRTAADEVKIEMTLSNRPKAISYLVMADRYASGKLYIRGGIEFRDYVVNNAVMILYAFAGAFHHRLLQHASVIKRAERSEERRVGKECRSRWSPYH